MGDPILLSPPHVSGGELELLTDALDSGWLAPLGPHVDAFESEFADEVGTAAAAALSSGTAALHLCYQLVGLEPGDDILIPDLSFIATGNAAAYVGANPVLVDIHPDTWTIDPDLVADTLRKRSAAGRLPAAVVTVDLFGQSADYDPLLETCAEYQVPLIDDAAEALGATYRGRPVGSFGAAAAFSFNGNKIITTSGGGMLVSQDPELIARARYLASQAKVAGTDYEHSEIAYNYRLSNLLAAVGRAQLRNLPERIARRRAIFARYQEAFADLEGLGFMPEADYGTSTRWMSIITIDPKEAPVTRHDVQSALAQVNIESRPVFRPLHMQKPFAGAEFVGGAAGGRIYERALCLPCGSGLADSEQERVIDGVRQQWA